MKILSRLAFFIFISVFLTAAKSPWQDVSENFNAGKIRLLQSKYSDEFGDEKILLGLHFKLKKGWKIYGRDSSGVGMAPSIDFENLVKSYKILWPQAILQQEKIGQNILKYTIYKDEIILPVELDKKNLGRIDLTINYGLCKDICIPANSQFSIFLRDEIDEKSLGLIEKFLPQNQSKTPPQKKSITLISAIIAAFIGGLILNIMPCVLPVLGIKILSIINHKNTSINKIRLAFLSSSLGIMACFLLFAIIAILIAKAGNIFNWGIQFQNPYFLISLIIILLFFSANMLGFFEIKFSNIIANSLNKKIDNSSQKNHVVIPNFLSGVLAVLLATPCSAPFLGSAISFAVTQEFLVILTIFLVMGFGFALPYFILIIWPKSVYLLPKSGAWMQKVKKFMAALLIVTIFWLLYILLGNLGAISTIIIGAILFLVILVFKIQSKILQFICFVILLFSIFCVPEKMKDFSAQNYSQEKALWVEFDEQKIDDYVATGKTVIIDVTANWCLTCKFNKYTVLRDKEVISILQNPDIIAMRADITRPNPKVMDFINRHNRYAIPFNAVFGPFAKDGLLTSELLRKKQFINLIKKASNNDGSDQTNN